MLDYTGEEISSPFLNIHFPKMSFGVFSKPTTLGILLHRQFYS
jgi:hypothetical protein